MRAERRLADIKRPLAAVDAICPISCVAEVGQMSYNAPIALIEGLIPVSHRGKSYLTGWWIPILLPVLLKGPIQL